MIQGIQIVEDVLPDMKITGVSSASKFNKGKGYIEMWFWAVGVGEPIKDALYNYAHKDLPSLDGEVIGEGTFDMRVGFKDCHNGGFILRFEVY